MQRRNRSRHNPTRFEQIVALVPEVSSLHQVIQWGLAQRPPRAVDDVVTQDEFTNDVIMRWRDDVWLVFDAT